MNIISIIPARGGSKSIPKKNLVDFIGEPLILKTITQAQNSLNINRTIVSALNCQGGKGIGLSGKDASLLICKKMMLSKFANLFFVNIIVGIFISIFLIYSEKFDIIIKYDNNRIICLSKNYDWKINEYCE